MKLNDPFGRMSRRREREYASLRQSLLKAGFTDRNKAEALIQSLRQRSRIGLWVVIPLTLVATLVFREYAIFTLAFGALAILWLVNISRRGQEYISRYITEVCDQPEATGATADESNEASAAARDESSPR